MKAESYYQPYFDQFYRNWPHLIYSSYLDQYNAIMEDCVGWSDFWKTHLEKLGSYEVEETILNAQHLQKQWAKENNFSYSSENWVVEILEAQIDRFQPDILFINDIFYVTPSKRKSIKAKFPGVKLLIGWDGTGTSDIKNYEGYDLVLSCVRQIVDDYLHHGKQSLFFPLAFDPSVLEKISVQEEMYGVSFTGSLALFKGGHHTRLRLLGALAQEIKMNLWIPAFGSGWFPFSRWQLYRLIKGRFQEFIDVYKIRKRNQGALFGIDMYNVLASSKITINSHIDASTKSAANYRLFEATGVGSCLVTDWKDNLSEYFEPEKEVVTYRTPQECIEKVKYLLHHEEERKRIALAGQQKTHREFTFEKRIHKFAEEIQKYL